VNHLVRQGAVACEETPGGPALYRGAKG
jgi:hypothetical protein